MSECNLKNLASSWPWREGKAPWLRWRATCLAWRRYPPQAVQGTPAKGSQQGRDVKGLTRDSHWGTAPSLSRLSSVQFTEGIFIANQVSNRFFEGAQETSEGF